MRERGNGAAASQATPPQVLLAGSVVHSEHAHPRRSGTGSAARELGGVGRTPEGAVAMAAHAPVAVEDDEGWAGQCDRAERVTFYYEWRKSEGRRHNASKDLSNPWFSSGSLGPFP